MEINIDEEFKNDNNNVIKDEANVIPVNTDENIPVDNSSDNKIEIIDTDNKNNNINDEKIHLNSHQHHHHNNNNNNNFSLKLNNHLNNHHHHNCNNPNCPLNKKQSNFEQLKQHLFGLLKKGDNYINEYIDDLTFSFDKIISNSTFPLFLKQILHAKLILFWVFILNTKYLLDQIQTENFYLKLLIFLSFSLVLI